MRIARELQLAFRDWILCNSKEMSFNFWNYRHPEISFMNFYNKWWKNGLQSCWSKYMKGELP
jgi:hypothetical protein